MKTLYLIDGYAQFFRAFHAIRTPMTSPVTKEPTNLSFGYIGMLLKLLRGTPGMGGPPDYIACVLDVSGDRGTFRTQMYEAYKANRPPPPEGLAEQVERCKATMAAMGIPMLGVEGFEADDVIATIVEQFKGKPSDVGDELRIRIVSKDKDLKQLLKAGPAPVELFDIHTDLAIDVERLAAESGVTPAQVVDMLALMGDTADNVPGVEGIGPKTAAELITEYGTISAVLGAAEAGKIQGKRGEKLRAAAATKQLDLARALVLLRRDAPAQLDLAVADVKAFNLPALLPILKELGFHRYQTELALMTGVKLAGDATGAAGATGREQSKSATKPPAARKARGAAVDDGAGTLFGASLFDPPVQSGGAVDLASGLGGTLGGNPGELNTGMYSASWPEPHEYIAILTRKELDAMLAEFADAEIVAFDTETTGLSPLRDKLCGISLCAKPGRAFYIPVRSPEPDCHLSPEAVLEALTPWFADGTQAKCAHNAKFDMLVLRHAGFVVRGATETLGAGGRFGGDVDGDIGGDVGGFDSMIASYLIDASRSSHGLDSLALAELGHSNISITQLIGTGPRQRTFDTVALGAAVQYAAEDADVTLRLRNLMLPRLRELGLIDLFKDVEMPLVAVLAELEFNGITVDADELERQRARLQQRIDVIRKEIDGAADDSLGRRFNPDSPKQLSAVLFNKRDADEPGLGIKPVKRTATGFSTDIEVLERLAEDASITTPIPRLVADYRQLTKLVGTYLESLKEAINPDTGRIHASFNQTVAATGRLSSSDPNLQNIPIRTDVGREIRKAFTAGAGNLLVSADYSQIELRLLAHLSQDAGLLDAFDRGIDIHTAVAAQIHGVAPEAVTREQRGGAKMVNFGIVYGITGYGLGRRLGISPGEAEKIIADYKRKFSGITTFLQECVHFAEEHGYVETMLKRRRPIPDIHSPTPQRRAMAERIAINSVVQGSAADLIKLAMVDLHGRIQRGDAPKGLAMLLQIHDELVFECPAEVAAAAQELIVARMEAAMTLRAPLKADATVGFTWFDE